MRHSYSRITEDLLFTVLLTALAGWIGTPVTADLSLASHADACFVVAGGGHASQTGAIGGRQRMGTT